MNNGDFDAKIKVTPTLIEDAERWHHFLMRWCSGERNAMPWGKMRFHPEMTVVIRGCDIKHKDESARYVRKLRAYLNCKGYPIIGSRLGYYIAETSEEIVAYANSLADSAIAALACRHFILRHEFTSDRATLRQMGIHERHIQMLHSEADEKIRELHSLIAPHLECIEQAKDNAAMGEYDSELETMIFNVDIAKIRRVFALANPLQTSFFEE